MSQGTPGEGTSWAAAGMLSPQSDNEAQSLAVGRAICEPVRLDSEFARIKRHFVPKPADFTGKTPRLGTAKGFL
jgi:hypothetical protein